MSRLGLFVAALCGVPFIAVAQTELVLPTMVVSPTLIATSPAEIGSDVTVITADDIDRNQWRTLPEALRAVPGVYVTQNGGPGSAAAIFIRGANANHTKVLLDGIDVSDPSTPNGAVDFSQIQLSDVARIEILRGPTSSLYGSDAIGGVILIETKKGAGGPNLTGTVEGGSHGTFNQAAGMSGGGARYNYAFNIQHFQSADTPVTPLELVPPGQVVHSDFYDNLTLSTRLGADFSEQLGANVVARYTRSTLDFTAADDLNFTVPATRRSNQIDQQLFARGETRVTLLDGAFDNRFGLAYTDDWTRHFDGTAFEIFSPPVTFDIGHRIKADWKGKYVLAPDEKLLFGAEAERDDIFSSPIDAHNGDQAVFAEWQGRIVDNLFGAASVRYDHNDRFGSAVTWRVAPTYTVADWGTQLKFSAGSAFKAPTLNQLFVSIPAFLFTANPNLQPERSFGIDAGFEQPLLNNRLRFGASYFHNDISNLIEFQTNPITFASTLVNIGNATTQGAETFATFTVTPQLDLRADYTYTLAMNDDTGTQLIRRPKHKASLSVSWRPTDRLTLAATGIYVGDRPDIAFSGLSSAVAKPYYLVNLDGSYRLTQTVTVFARIENLLNQHYEDVVGFLRPGIGVFGGIRVAFDAKAGP
ncbi:MAG TPA: TonB-dependent receptor [Stellaceae bacterium]|jgi:vitamin B12 transporter